VHHLVYSSCQAKFTVCVYTSITILQLVQTSLRTLSSDIFEDFSSPKAFLAFMHIFSRARKPGLDFHVQTVEEGLHLPSLAIDVGLKQSRL
jgi:hypothetical protein